jgi:hypothetical protein
MTKKKQNKETKNECEENGFTILGYIVTIFTAVVIVITLTSTVYKVYNMDNKRTSNEYLKQSMYMCDFHGSVRGYSRCVQKYLE